jgi:hypothetical protein
VVDDGGRLRPAPVVASQDVGDGEHRSQNKQTNDCSSNK